MKYLIINADDFGKFTAVNDGIIEGVERGVITSTSVLVYGKHAADIAKIVGSTISIGLHFDPSGIEDKDIEAEFHKQLELFEKIVGRGPDHVDSHKIRPKDLTLLKDALQDYSDKHNTPLRDWGHAHFIDTFFGLSREDYKTVDLDRISPEALIRILDTELKDGYNEMMCHAGRVDNEVIEGSSYNTPRANELQTLLSEEFREYLNNRQDIQLISWKGVNL